MPDDFLRKYPALRKLSRLLPWTLEIVGVTPDEKHFLLKVRDKGPVRIGFENKHLNKARFEDVLWLMLYHLSKQALVLYHPIDKDDENTGIKKQAKARTPRGEEKN